MAKRQALKRNVSNARILLFYSMYKSSFLLLLAACAMQCSSSKKGSRSSTAFPEEIVHFVPYGHNPVFAGTGANTWDDRIRERGYILREDSTYYLWYTGYKKGEDNAKYLGYATSPDGYTWTRYKDNPVYSAGWVEDMSVIHVDSTYYMFAEGRDDIAHLLTSTDRIHWTEQGPLDIRMVNGVPISKGAYGTPTVWKENGTWYLFYERGDLGVWLAVSKNLKQWTNVQDGPVLKMGPEPYDRYAVAMNQVIKHKGRYYGYYHASAYANWREWSTCVAVSDDLIHWKKYKKNPIIGNNTSSGIIVNDGKRFRMYTMHPDMRVFLQANDSLP
ncbi:glycosylase [Agriterribacter sp.]|uniref:glycosylase n=1 Tax=Agriterribacter sp. TaxID=2821509 RepID=UPI002C4B3242|nr:glycosylase [Agriterribacter sp.]HTN06444.1 hypothetical protein [Agriterribacter sp.]